jgi:hypothetical protein
MVVGGGFDQCFDAHAVMDCTGFPEAIFVENYAAILGSSRVA